MQKIINADPERLHTSKNAAFAIALAAEMFIQHLATTTHNVVKAERKPRRNIQYRDVSTAVAKTDNLEFLTDVVPKTMTMKEYKKREEIKRKAKEVADKEREREKALAKEKEQKDKEKAGENGEATPAAAAAAQSGGGLKNGDVREAFKAKTNGHAAAKESDQPPNKPNPSADNEPVEEMDVDQDDNNENPKDTMVVEDSEPEEDGAAMQIEMEMRGPRHSSSSTATHRRSSGFTAISTFPLSLVQNRRGHHVVRYGCSRILRSPN